jgi:hypothetical protein
VVTVLVDPNTSMIFIFIRSTIGTFGNALLDFYIANSIWINGLVLLYGLLVVFSRHSFNLSQQLLLSSLQSRYGGELDKKRPASVLNILKKANIPWEEALRRTSIPFMTPPGSIRIYPKNLETFQKFVSLEKLAELLKQS